MGIGVMIAAAVHHSDFLGLGTDLERLADSPLQVFKSNFGCSNIWALVLPDAQETQHKDSLGTES